MRVVVICLAFFICLFYSRGCPAQAFDNDFTRSFAFKVHSIDDFFDRFNFKKNTGFQNFLRRNYPEQKLTRKQVIGSLFNNTNPELMSNPYLMEFIDQVTDSVSPRFMSYSDMNWFAELTCKVIYKGIPKKLIMVVKVERAVNNSYRWSIISAYSDFLKIKPTLSDSLKFMQIIPKRDSLLPDGRLHSLSPVSHGIDFVNLANFFEDIENLTDYLHFSQESMELRRLILLIKKSEVKFVQVNTIVYHLLQINDWILRIEEFNHNDQIAGWRVNKLIKVNPQQKRNYVKSRLNIQTS